LTLPKLCRNIGDHAQNRAIMTGSLLTIYPIDSQRFRTMAAHGPAPRIRLNPGVGGSIPSLPTISFLIISPSCAALTPIRRPSPTADFANTLPVLSGTTTGVVALLGLEQRL
jgi:hypothetical protein